MRRLEEQRIETRPLWQPLHASPAHRGAQVLGGEVAEALNARALSLPSSCGLTAAEQERVVAAIADAAR
jgi:dTDP-4-amino-4,6-dideoxygalactose transaminase